MIEDVEFPGQTLMNWSSAGVVIVDGDGQIVDLNSAMTALVDMSREKLLNSSIYTHIVMDETDALLSDNWVKDGIGQLIGCLVSDRHNSIPVEISVNQLGIANGLFMITLSPFRGKGATSAALNKHYFELPTQLMMVLDDDGHVVDINRYGANMLGSEVSSIIGKTFGQHFLPFRDRDRFADTLRTVTSGKGVGVVRQEYRLIGESGEIKTMVIAFHQSEGEPIKVICVGDDVSEIKRRKQEEIRLQKHMMQAQKIEVIGRLTGGLAHDFNNVLASILGYCSLAKDRLEHDKLERIPSYLEQVLTAGERAKNLIGQMLAFSQLGSQEKQNVNLAQEVTKVLATAAYSLPSSIQLEENCQDEQPEVFIDHSGFEQLMMNILLNAGDAMSGKGRIKVDVARAHKSGAICSSCHQVLKGDFASITIIDTGPGVSREVASHIFDPFFSTKRPGVATGMGLPVVHGLMHGYEGHILVEPDRLSGFSIQLLFPIANPYSLLNKSKRKHVVVVDDDYMVCEFINNILSKEGYKVTTFCDALEAKEFILSSLASISAVIADEMMPEMRGSELCHVVAAQSDQVKTAIVTAYERKIDVERLQEIGVGTLLVKPLSKERVLETMKRMMEL